MQILYTAAVSGLNCTVTVGSLSHHSKIVFVEHIFILDGYTVPCTGTVVAWEFCYRISNGTATFYPGIWRRSEKNDANTVYELIQSNSVTYDATIQTSSVDSCQRVNLSTTDQFTAPAGSFVGLYSNVMTKLLHTNTDSSITTYQYQRNQSRVMVNPGRGDNVNYSIAIKVYLG